MQPAMERRLRVNFLQNYLTTVKSQWSLFTSLDHSIWKQSLNFFFSAHNCRHFPSRNWSRWTLWLYIPDSVAGVDSYVQSITSPNGCIPCLADKTCLHSIAEWHTALRVMYVRRSFVLLSWLNCGVHNNNVPWCFLWSYRNFHHCRDNFDSIASIC